MPETGMADGRTTFSTNGTKLNKRTIPESQKLWRVNAHTRRAENAADCERKSTSGRRPRLTSCDSVRQTLDDAEHLEALVTTAG